MKVFGGGTGRESRKTGQNPDNFSLISFSVKRSEEGEMTEWTTGTLDIGYREKKKSEGMDIFQTKQLLPGFDTNGRSGRKTGDDNRKRYF